MSHLNRSLTLTVFLLSLLSVVAWESVAVGDLLVAAKGVPLLLQQYVDAVQALSMKAAEMRTAGKSAEEIARALHTERRALGEFYKNLTPADVLKQIYERNLAKYGDKLGPTIEYLRNKGKTWEEIIESAFRTGGKDLGL